MARKIRSRFWRWGDDGTPYLPRPVPGGGVEWYRGTDPERATVPLSEVPSRKVWPQDAGPGICSWLVQATFFTARWKHPTPWKKANPYGWIHRRVFPGCFKFEDIAGAPPVAISKTDIRRRANHWRREVAPRILAEAIRQHEIEMSDERARADEISLELEDED